MTKEIIKAYKSEIGEIPACTIVALTNQLVRYGLCSRDEADDIASDLFLRCKQISLKYSPTNASMSTYLVTCINNMKGRIFEHFKFRNSSLLTFDLSGDHHTPIPLEDEENFGFCDMDDENTVNLPEMYRSQDEELLREDLYSVIQTMDSISQKILSAMLNEGLSPSTACKRFNRSHMFFCRHILPILKKKMKKDVQISK